MKYYIDGVREFFIDTKSRKVKNENAIWRKFQTTNKDITQQKKRVVMIGITPGVPYIEKESLYEETLKDERKRIEGGFVYGDSTQIGRCEVYPDKKEIVLSCDQLYPKSYKKWNLFGYKNIMTEHRCTEVYSLDENVIPTIYNLKSASGSRHYTFSNKHFVWDIDNEDMFFVVEREFTDSIELSPYEIMKQDYDKYSKMYPADEKTKSQLAGMEEVDDFSEL